MAASVQGDGSPTAPGNPPALGLSLLEAEATAPTPMTLDSQPVGGPGQGSGSKAENAAAQRLMGATGEVPAAEPLPQRSPPPDQPEPQPPGLRPAPPSSPRAPAERGQNRGGTAGSGSARPQTPAQGRTAADLEQQIQFDQSGLITMHTNELDIRVLLEIISRRSGRNLLVSPNVKGTITANFERVNLEELLAGVLKLANLVEKKEGLLSYIFTREEARAQSESTKKERILTKVYRLNYIRADELMSMIKPFLSLEVGQKRLVNTPAYRFGISEAATFTTGGGAAGGGAAGGGGGGAGGGAAVQAPTGGNSLSGEDVLVVQDYESNLKIVDQIIQRLDVQPVQVLIEAVIISVALEKSKQLGVNFGVVDNLGQTLGTVGSGAVLNGNVGFNPVQLLTAAGKLAAGTPADSNGFTSDTNGIKFGFVSNNVTGFVRALDTMGSTKILASPRILVLNKQRAEIQLGARLGFRTLSQNFTSTIQQVQFLNTGTLLRLRPFVSEDGMVRMEIHPERSQGSVNADGLPNSTTAELTTNVMVPDGATLVIGGLMEDDDEYTQQGLPGLSRLPMLGHLFGLKEKIDNRRELVVLLTPHIWPGRPVGAPAARGRGRAEEPTALKMSVLSPATAPVPVANKPAPARSRLSAFRGGRGRDPVAPSPSARTTPAPADPATASPIPTPASGGAPRSPAFGQVEAPAQARVHVVRPGEDLSSIARSYYGSDRYTAALWKANRDVLTSPSQISPGTALEIPHPSRLDPALTAAITPSPGATSETAAMAPANRPGGRTVTSSRPSSPRQAPGMARSDRDDPPEIPPAGVPTAQRPNLAFEPTRLKPTLGTLESSSEEMSVGGVSAGRSEIERTEAPAPTRSPNVDPLVAQTHLESPAVPDRDENRGYALPGRPAAAPARAPTGRRGGSTGSYRHGVKAGESFWSIARLYYKSEGYDESLWWVNRQAVERPDALTVGTILAIPRREQLDALLALSRGTESRPTMMPAIDPEEPAEAAVETAPAPIPVAEPQGAPGVPEPAESPQESSNRLRAEGRSDREPSLGHDPRGRASQAAPAPVGRNRYPVHIVVPGETLWSIARGRLGDARRATEILELNRDRIPNPDQLTPGLRLFVPADALRPRREP